MSRIGFTTSIPVEVILAAGKTPVDLNNVFINMPSPQELVNKAEEEGYPRNTCGWIKGLYAIAAADNLEAVIAVMQGDCSNTQALMETLQLHGVNMLPFAYPWDRDKENLRRQLYHLMDSFGVGLSEVEKVREQLQEIRRLCRRLDELTWKDNVVSGKENHIWLVSSSDFNGNPEVFQRELEQFICRVRQRDPFDDQVRLAYIGVPPIFSDLYEVIESMGARVVFNEIQRQFSMPYETSDIFEQYVRYTYPYGAFARLEDIVPELVRRNVQGVIHYTQTFCFRQIEDMVFHEKIKLPFLTLEGDRPGKLDARSRMRLEAFINMLRNR